MILTLSLSFSLSQMHCTLALQADNKATDGSYLSARDRSERGRNIYLALCVLYYTIPPCSCSRTRFLTLSLSRARQAVCELVCGAGVRRFEVHLLPLPGRAAGRRAHGPPRALPQHIHLGAERDCKQQQQQQQPIHFSSLHFSSLHQQSVLSPVPHTYGGVLTLFYTVCMLYVLLCILYTVGAGGDQGGGRVPV